MSALHSPAEMLVENAAYRPELSASPHEHGFFMHLPYGFVEINFLNETEDRAVVQDMQVPEAIRGHDTGSRLLAAASLECVNRGVTDLLAYIRNPSALRCFAKVFGTENLQFLIVPREKSDADFYGYTRVPMIYKEAIAQAIRIEGVAEYLDAQGMQEWAALMDKVRLTVDLNDEQTLASLQHAAVLYEA